MKRKLGTLATCGVLMFSYGAAATAEAGQGASKKCERLTKKYLVALDKGQNRKAKQLERRLKKAGCEG